MPVEVATKLPQFYLTWAGVMGNAMAGIAIISCAKTIMVLSSGCSGWVSAHSCCVRVRSSELPCPSMWTLPLLDHLWLASRSPTSAAGSGGHKHRTYLAVSLQAGTINVSNTTDILWQGEKLTWLLEQSECQLYLQFRSSQQA